LYLLTALEGKSGRQQGSKGSDVDAAAIIKILIEQGNQRGAKAGKECAGQVAWAPCRQLTVRIQTRLENGPIQQWVSFC